MTRQPFHCAAHTFGGHPLRYRYVRMQMTHPTQPVTIGFNFAVNSW